MKLREFFGRLLDGDDLKSSKRFITLIAAGIFFLVCLLVLFFTFYLVLYVPKGSVNVDLLNELSRTREDLKFIVMGGLGLVGAEGLAKIFVSKFKKGGSYSGYGYGGDDGCDNSNNRKDDIEDVPPVE